MMTYNLLAFASVMLTALAMGAGLAHALELSSKLPLSAAEYLTVQQIYRGWSLLGIVVVGALLSSLALAISAHARGRSFYPPAIAVVCITLALVVFFTFTQPVNRITENWHRLPDDWQALRRTWEYSHAVGCGLNLTALAALVIGLLPSRA